MRAIFIILSILLLINCGNCGKSENQSSAEPSDDPSQEVLDESPDESSQEVSDESSEPPHRSSRSYSHREPARDYDSDEIERLRQYGKFKETFDHGTRKEKQKAFWDMAGKIRSGKYGAEDARELLRKYGR